MQNYSSASITLINNDSSEELKHLLSHQKVTLIGRSPDCDIVLDPNKYPTVSRYHVQIELIEKNNQLSWAITDKGTTNGTLINGEKISATHILRSSDRIMLGLKGPEFLFEMEALSATVLVELPEEKPEESKEEESQPVEEVSVTSTETKEVEPQEVKEVETVAEETTAKAEEEKEETTTPEEKSIVRDRDKIKESSLEARKARREIKTRDKDTEPSPEETTTKAEEQTKVEEKEEKTTVERKSRLRDKESPVSAQEEKTPVESAVKKEEKPAAKEEIATEAKVEIDWNSLPSPTLSESNVWNLIKIKELATLEIDTKEIQCLSFNPQNQILAIAGKDKNIQLWDWQNKKEIVTFDKAHKMAINTLRFSSDSKKLVSSGSDKTIKVWDVEKQSEICSLSGHKMAINSVILSNDGSKLVSSGSDKTIIVWDVEKQSEICSLLGHKMAINSLCLSADNKYLISGGGDKVIKIWNLETNEEEKTITTDSKSGIQSLSFSPDGNLILCIFQDNIISVFDRHNDLELFRLNAPEKAGEITTVNHEGNLFASLLKEGGILIWQI
jgi:pSer/pThr/pTyr-binding forkhead associated (FHA) protein